MFGIVSIKPLSLERHRILKNNRKQKSIHGKPTTKYIYHTVIELCPDMKFVTIELIPAENDEKLVRD